MARGLDELTPESDALGDAPHPRFTDVLYGQEAAENELLRAYKLGKLPHAWIFGGEKGIGKATLAWRFAKFVLSFPDSTGRSVQNATSLAVPPQTSTVQRIHALGHGDVHVLRREWNDKTKKFFTDIRAEDVRAATHLFQRASSEGGYRIVILDCAEDLNATSANSLLKMIEEPPEKSLFLIVSHRPNQILPTIRSRCRKLMLKALDPQDCAKALAAFVAPDMRDEIDRACALAQGSVARALKLMSGKSLDTHKTLQRALDLLPKVDWREIHTLADSVAARANSDEYDTLIDGLQNWLARQIDNPDASLKALAAWAAAWVAIETQVRETEIFNLDRRALLLALFSELAAAAENARIA